MYNSRIEHSLALASVISRIDTQGREEGGYAAIGMAMELLTMAAPKILALLRNIGAAMVPPRSRLSGGGGWAQPWSKLRLRLVTVFCPVGGKPSSAIPVVRDKITQTLPFRVEADERIVDEVKSAGWGRDWIQVESQEIEIDLAAKLERFMQAVEVLPEIRRTIFLAHARDELPFDAIADQVGISLADVQREFTAAMAAVDAAMDES